MDLTLTHPGPQKGGTFCKGMQKHLLHRELCIYINIYFEFAPEGWFQVNIVERQGDDSQ